MSRRIALAALTSSTLLLAACGTGTSGNGTAGSSGSGDKVDVVAGFYPLQYALERIGGDHVKVTNLTKPGAEPHDVELTPKDVATVSEADLAVYEKNVQPAVAEAVTSQNVKNQLEVSTIADESKKFTDPVVGGEEDEHAHEGEAGATGAPEEHDHAHEHASEPGSVDPHFWLDPVRYTAVAEGIEKKLEEVDPQHAATYKSNLENLKKDLSALDAEYKTGLTSCSNKTLVTSHAAFGYLADRYGFTQAAISGLSPESEPDPAHLAEVADYAKKNNVKAIYAETLTDPAIAQTVARETGAKTMVLDPLEGLTKQGSDYLSVMRDNLATLKTGQGCS